MSQKKMVELIVCDKCAEEAGRIEDFYKSDVGVIDNGTRESACCVCGKITGGRCMMWPINKKKGC